MNVPTINTASVVAIVIRILFITLDINLYLPTIYKCIIHANSSFLWFLFFVCSIVCDCNKFLNFSFPELSIINNKFLLSTVFQRNSKSIWNNPKGVGISYFFNLVYLNRKFVILKIKVWDLNWSLSVNK